MERTYFTFGIKEPDMEKVKSDLEKLLDVSFEAHESSYKEDYYLYENENNNEGIEIIKNYIDEDWQEEDHKDCPILLNLNRFADSDNIFTNITTNLPYIIPISKSYFPDDSTYSDYIYKNGEFKFIKKGTIPNWKKKKKDS